jgi:hypothetical protein
MHYKESTLFLLTIYPSQRRNLLHNPFPSLKNTYTYDTTYSASSNGFSPSTTQVAVSNPLHIRPIRAQWPRPSTPNSIMHCLDPNPRPSQSARVPVAFCAPRSAARPTGRHAAESR